MSIFFEIIGILTIISAIVALCIYLAWINDRIEILQCHIDNQFDKIMEQSGRISKLEDRNRNEDQPNES